MGKIKKWASCALALSLALGGMGAASVFAAAPAETAAGVGETAAETAGRTGTADGGAAGFVTLRMDYPEGEKMSYVEQDALLARYADDKTPIPVSQYYDGMMFAIVPEANQGRELEAFSAEDVTFADYDSEKWEFSMLSDLAGKGIIRGNAKGEAEPFRTITRAEAVSMMVKMTGIPVEKGADSGFSDVKKDAWYSDIVAAAVKQGIVARDAVFNPERPVSREEATTMLVNAFRQMGVVGAPRELSAEEFAEETGFGDAASVSAYARQAYLVVGGSGITSSVETGEIAEDGGIIADTYLYPQQEASRAEVGELMWRAMFQFPSFPSRLAIQYGFDKEMPVIDGSTSTYPFTKAVYGKLFSNGTRNTGMPQAHSKSHASYQRLISGEVDMLFASVYPASDILAMAKEAGVELELVPIAYDAQIFFTNADNPAVGLPKEQISRIYVDNAYRSWNEIGGPDALLYPYCRNNDSGSHAQMERHFLNGHEINEQIRLENTSLMMSSILTEVEAARTEEPRGYALGYSIYYYYQMMTQGFVDPDALKLLAIDGVYPTDETIADGSYPLSNNTYLVLRKDAAKDAPARKMAEFMLTEAGQECVANAGFGPLSGGK